MGVAADGRQEEVVVPVVLVVAAETEMLGHLGQEVTRRRQVRVNFRLAVPVDGQPVECDQFEHGALLLRALRHELGRPVVVARLRRQRLDAHAAGQSGAGTRYVVFVSDVDILDLELDMKARRETRSLMSRSVPFATTLNGRIGI